MHFTILTVKNRTIKDETNYVNIICSNIAENSTMKSILHRSSQGFDELKTFNNKYLTHQQLSRKCNSYHAELNKSKLQIFHMQRKLNKLGSTLDMHQRFLLSVSQHNIPRLKELVAVAMRNKRSISYIISQVLNAIDGVYLARPSENDKDLAYLILQFGGPALVDICHRANCLPSSYTAYRMAKQLKQIDCSINYTAKVCMQINISLNEENSTYSYSLKADETYVNPHVRYDSKSDEVKGLCYQHGENYKSFTSFEEAETVAEAIRNSEVHVPKECLVISGCAMNNTSSSYIILAWLTCDKKDFDGAFKHFKSLISTYHDITKKPLMNFSTDDDGTRRQVFNHLLDNTLNEDSPVGDIICGLEFVDLQCGTYQEILPVKTCITSMTGKYSATFLQMIVQTALPVKVFIALHT